MVNWLLLSPLDPPFLNSFTHRKIYLFLSFQDNKRAFSLAIKKQNTLCTFSFSKNTSRALLHLEKKNKAFPSFLSAKLPCFLKKMRTFTQMQLMH